MELITNLGGANSKEFAQQLTLFEWNLFHQISIKDLMDYSKGIENAISIQASILWFNNLSNSITIDILKPDLKQRVETTAFWIKVANYCRKLNNYNAVMEIVASLGSVSISRLQRTWSHLPKKYVRRFKACESLMSSVENYKEYRTQLEKVGSTNACAVPYLGMYLRDVIFIDENPATLEHGEINQFKVDLERQLIRNVVKFQDRNYKFQESARLKMILDSWKKTNTNANCIENGLYERSILMEPCKNNIETLDDDLVKQIFKGSPVRKSSSAHGSLASSHDSGSTGTFEFEESSHSESNESYT